MAIQGLGSSYTYRGDTADYMTITPEQVLGVYQMVSANETPMQGTFPAVQVRNTHHEWLVDDIARPTNYNQATPEGAVTLQTAAARQRIVGQCAEYGWKVRTTDRAREIEVFGMEDPHWTEITRQVTRMAMQVDVDLMFNTYQAGSLTTSAPASGTALRGAGLLDWTMLTAEARANGVSTWSCSGNTGISSTYSAYHNDLGATISESEFVNTLQGSWAIGNNISNCVIHTSADWKKTISGFNFYYASADTTIPLSRVAQELSTKNVVMDFYKSEFGMVVVMINRDLNDGYSTSTRAYEDTSDTTASPDYETVTFDQFLIGFDPSYVDIAFAQYYRIEPLAKTDLTTTTAISCSAGMRPRNPKALFAASYTA